MDEQNRVPENWRDILEEYERRIAYGRSMGGEEKLRRRTEQGLCNAREIIELLCDAGSFQEIGTLAGGFSYHGEKTAPADALVGGFATINGRAVVVGAEDFTVMGGSIGPGTNAKKLRLAEMAYRERVPYIMLLDGAGERMSNTLERRAHAPNDMQILARLSGLVPTVAVVYGASAGHGAITGLLMDFVVMVEGGAMFSAGPPLVYAATGEQLDKEELGGAAMHTGTSGVGHNLARDAEHACAMTAHYLSFLPSNAWEYPPDLPFTQEQGERELPEILDIIPANPQQPYDMRRVIHLLIDSPEQWLELQPDYGTAILCGLARFGGASVGIVANQPTQQAGAITWQAADKASHFLELCEAYHLPVLFLADNPGVMTGGRAEREGTLRAAARMYAAQCRLRTPKLHATLRKAFGFGSSLMAMNPFDNQTLSVAFPAIHLGAMPAQGGSDAAGLDASGRQAMDDAQNNSAWTAGDTLAYDQVIDPRQLRNSLLQGMRRFRRRAVPASPSQHTGIRP